jgi:hypothetical protein
VTVAGPLDPLRSAARARFRHHGDADLAWLGKRGVASADRDGSGEARDMAAKKQRALVTSKGGLPAVPATPGIVSVAEAHRALNEATILHRAALSMTLNFQDKEKERRNSNE